MLRRSAFLLLWCLGLTLSVTAAKADPTFVFLRSFQDPANFESQFNRCISQFNAAGGLPSNILNQLNGAEVVVYYQRDGAGVPNPNPGGDSTGRLLYLYWDSNLSGRYEEDGVAKDPCAALLHELEHASRYYSGKECTGPLAFNRAAYQYDEKLGARAENWWLRHIGNDQRQYYGFYGHRLRLDGWTRWPPPAGSRVPNAPRCNRSCPRTASSVLASTDASAAECGPCRRFQQPGCIDFKGGIYSGGDHRRVANGSLRIIVGDAGYCQGRRPCEFRNCVTCPHLDTAFPVGARVTAIATPGRDSKFARWGPGVCAGKGPTCTFTASRKSCISAQFVLTNPTAPPQSLRRVPCREDP